MHFKDETLQGFLSKSISQNKRTWDKNNNCWVVTPEVLPEVISYSRHLFNHIESSSIPVRYQTVVQEALQGKINTKNTKSKTSFSSPVKDVSPYKVLYITPDAPKFIVKAVYKALAFEYHPDRGGDSERFQELAEAYATILKEKIS